MSYENKPIIFHFNDPIAENTLYLDRDGVINKAVIRAKEISSPRNMKELKISNDLISLNSRWSHSLCSSRRILRKQARST